MENRERAFIADPDQLPFPAYEKFELAKYAFDGERRIGVTTSRGCPHGCVYCAARLSMGRPFRPRSPENVLSEIAHWHRQGFREFDFQDDCFSFDLARAKRICDLILESGLDIKWYLGTGIRVDRIDEELLAKMKRSGCAYICYGVESGSDAVLRAIKKAITVDQARETLEMTRRAGITAGANFIVGHPTETLAEAMKSLEFAKAAPADVVFFYNLIPYPGTALYRYVESSGTWLMPKDRYLEKATSQLARPVFETPEFRAAERIRVLEAGQSYSRKTVSRKLFGPYLGALFWAVTRYRAVEWLGRNLAFGSRFGRRLLGAMKRS